jgi:hypothetical protein
VLSLKITKSTGFWKFFRRETAVSCSMCKKLCPLPCNAKMKQKVNRVKGVRRGRAGQHGEDWNSPSSGDRNTTLSRKRRGEEEQRDAHRKRTRSCCKGEKEERSWSLEVCPSANTCICGESREVPASAGYGWARGKGRGLLLAHI